MASRLSAAFDLSVERSPDITLPIARENTVYIRGLWPIPASRNSGCFDGPVRPSCGKTIDPTIVRSTLPVTCAGGRGQMRGHSSYPSRPQVRDFPFFEVLSLPEIPMPPGGGQ